MTLNDRECPDTSQGGEAVEVVGYGCEGQIEVLKHVPLTGGMKVSGREREKYNVPLMTVAQHQRILLSTVIRCEQKGAFKTCLECGYQDGHDLICQYHESKRAAVSNDLTNVRCLCCQSEHAHNSYDAGFIAGSGMCQVCDAALPARGVPEGKEFSQFLSAVMDAAGLVRHGRQSKELSEYLGSKCMEYMLSATHPADQVADDLTMVKVPRELANIAALHLENSGYTETGKKLRALLNGGRDE